MMMIWAYVSTGSDFVKHSLSDRGNFYLKIPPYSANNTNNTNSTDSGGDSIGLFDLTGKSTSTVDIMWIHGWVLWFAWGFLGFIQIASARYLKIFPKVNMYIHIISGIIINFLTILLSVYAFQYSNWKVNPNSNHSLMGYFVLVAQHIMTALGFLTWILNKNLKW